MIGDIIEETVGKAYYSEMTSHIPVDFKPTIIRSDKNHMPGMEDLGKLTELGDTKVNDMIVGKGINSEWDKKLVFTHYLKGLKLKHDLANKLNIQDRTGFGDVALGYGMQNHYYMDEFGTSMTTEQKFPDFIVNACLKIMIDQSSKAIRILKDSGDYDKLDLDDYSNVVASYPRGKNTGLPWVVSGGDRFQNDIVLAANALIAKLFVDGYTREQVFKDLYMGYLVFSRFQRTVKSVPMYMDGKILMSKQFEPRRRVVNGTPKAMAMAVKPLVKWWTNVALEMPVFSQDRKSITRRIEQSPVVFASDASRFDLRSGGIKLRQGLQILWDVAIHHHPTIPKGVYTTMMDEAFLPTLASYGYPEARLFESSESALRSGASTTSRVGSVINLMYDMMIEAERIKTKDADVLANYYLRYQPSVILGDDLLKLYNNENVKRHGGKDAYAEKMTILKTVGMEVELEEPTKFLGYHVENKQLVHGTSPLDNMFFPERYNTNPVASVMMRYIILKNPNAFNALDIMANVMRHEKAAESVYRDFVKDCRSTLALHYEDHPSGAAKAFFQRIKPEYSGKDVQKNLHSDMDSVLTFISKGSAYDFNYALVGLPELNDVVDEDKNVLKSSLNEMINNASQIARGSNIMKGSSSNVKDWASGQADGLWLSQMDDRRKMGKIENALRLFDQKDPESIIATFHSMLPKIARQVKTHKGSIYVGNI